MDAKSLLQSQGWRGDGHSLDTTNRGLSRPLLVQHKVDLSGLGTKKHDFNNEWWMTSFDKSLKGIGGNPATAAVVQIELPRLKGFKYDNLYTNFKKAEIMESTIDKDDPIFGIAYSDTKPMKEDPQQVARRRTSFVEDGAVLGMSGIEEVRKERKKEKNDRKEKKDKKRKRESGDDEGEDQKTTDSEEGAEKRRRKEIGRLARKQEKKSKAKEIRATAKEDRKARKAKRAELKMQNKVRHEEAVKTGSESLTADVLPSDGDTDTAVYMNNDDTGKRKKKGGKSESKKSSSKRQKEVKSVTGGVEISIPIRSLVAPLPESVSVQPSKALPASLSPPKEVDQVNQLIITTPASLPRVRPIRAQAAAERQVKRDTNGAQAQAKPSQAEQSTEATPAKPPKRDQFGARLNRVRKPKHRAGKGGRSKETMTGANDIPLGVRR